MKVYSDCVAWLAVQVPNTEVRANSAGLLFDAFPLQDPNSTAEDTDFLIQKQFDFMQVWEHVSSVLFFFAHQW